MMQTVFWACIAFILYTYAGYPVLLALLARFRPAHPIDPQPDEPDLPFVTLLIAAYNEQAVIHNKLENSLALDYPRQKLQVLVAADGSDDATVDIVRSYAGQGVELSYQPERLGKMAAINRAMLLARGQIVVFSDANNLYTPETIRKLVAPFADSQIGAASGAKSIIEVGGQLDESEGLYWKYEAFIKKQETRLGSCTGVSGEIFALRRELYSPPPARIINDDFYLALQVLKQGRRLVYVPEARSMEYVSPSSQDEVTRRARIVAGRYQAIVLAPQILPWKQPLLVWQIVSHKFFRPLVPLAMAGALVANLGWGLRKSPPAGLAKSQPPNRGLAWGIFALQVAFYAAAGLGSRLTLPGKVGKLLFLPTFLVNSNLAALLGLYRHLTGGQNVTWQRVRRKEEIE